MLTPIAGWLCINLPWSSNQWQQKQNEQYQYWRDQSWPIRLLFFNHHHLFTREEPRYAEEHQGHGQHHNNIWCMSATTPAFIAVVTHRNLEIFTDSYLNQADIYIIGRIFIDQALIITSQTNTHLTTLDSWIIVALTTFSSKPSHSAIMIKTATIMWGQLHRFCASV